MRKSRRSLLLMAATAGVAAALAIPTPAYAAYWGSETDEAGGTYGPTGDRVCVEHTGVTACFKHNGDKLYVRDNREDGYAAVISWTLQTGRRGSCVNKLRAGNWGVCNKDFPENDRIWFWGARYNSGRLVDDGPAQVWNTSDICCDEG